MTRVRVSDLDAWLQGYEGVMPSPLHRVMEIGEASGVARAPTVNEWRFAQATAVSTDAGMVALAYAMGSEAMAPATTRGLTWYMTRFAVARYARYAAMAPVAGVAIFFVAEALSNWTPGKATSRNPRTGGSAWTIE